MINWTKIAKFTTDEFGSCKISGLNPEIDYAVTEVIAPTGYELCDEVWRINLTEPGLVNAARHTFEDYKVGHSALSKRDVKCDCARGDFRIKYIQNTILHAKNI